MALAYGMRVAAQWQPNMSSAVEQRKLATVDVDLWVRKLRSSVSRQTKEDKEVVSIHNVLTDANVIESIVDKVSHVIKDQPVCIETQAPIYCVGDIHGQFTDLLRIFEKVGWPSKDRKFIFLGDYVDRGPNSLECIVLLFLLKLQNPKSVILLRGNHECSAVNRVYGFFEECDTRFPEKVAGQGLWYAFQDAFNWLPLTAIIGGRILCMHGGLSPWLEDIADLKLIPRPLDPFDPGLAVDLLWSDPAVTMSNEPNDPMFEPSNRGISYHFNRRFLITFCNRNSLDFVVRGHQVVQDGYEFFAHRHLVTVFSAPNYCGTFNNHGAVLHVNKDFQCSITTFPPDKAAPRNMKLKPAEVTIDEIDIADAPDAPDDEQPVIVNAPPVVLNLLENKAKNLPTVNKDAVILAEHKAFLPPEVAGANVTTMLPIARSPSSSERLAKKRELLLEPQLTKTGVKLLQKVVQHENEETVIAPRKAPSPPLETAIEFGCSLVAAKPEEAAPKKTQPPPAAKSASLSSHEVSSTPTKSPLRPGNRGIRKVVTKKKQ